MVDKISLACILQQTHRPLISMTVKPECFMTSAQHSSCFIPTLSISSCRNLIYKLNRKGCMLAGMQHHMQPLEGGKTARRMKIARVLIFNILTSAESPQV
eukprot:scpid52305/ scgid16190/ 